MKPPKISVIIPIYNAEKYLKECLDSVLTQSLTNIEIICIDDCSTDNSLAILNEYKNNDSRIKIVPNKKNMGAGYARNIGVEIAQGDYLAFIDSDDKYINEFSLEKLYSKASRDNLDITICGASSYNNSTQEIENMYCALRTNFLPNKEIFSYRDMPHNIFNTFHNWNWNKLFKRSFIEENNIKFQNLHRTNDLFFTCSALVCAEKMGCLKESLILYRIGRTDNSQSTNDKYPYDFLKAFEELKSYLQKNNKYEKLKISFIKWAMDACIYNINSIQNQQIKEKLRIKISDKYIKKFDFIESDFNNGSTNEFFNEFWRIMPRHKIYNFLGVKLKIKRKYIAEKENAKMLDKIFSIKTEDRGERTYKVLTILGIKLKHRTNKNDFLKLREMLIYQDSRLHELLYRNVFVDSVQNSEWLKDKSFCLVNKSANYSFIFNLYKILDMVKPNNILELGLGQTSLLTSQYSDYFKKKLQIIEHNREWIEHFGKTLEKYQNHEIIHKNIIKFSFNNVESDKYEDLSNITQETRYDLIIIDGPFGYDRIYPRTNILDLIPNNLNENFVIILDDVERIGEQNTASFIFKKLKENNIDYIESYKAGAKSQLIISSKNYEFVHWY